MSDINTLIDEEQRTLSVREELVGKLTGDLMRLGTFRDLDERGIAIVAQHAVDAAAAYVANQRLLERQAEEHAALIEEARDKRSADEIESQ